ncbi:hypothetical protein I204_05278 [Kwoniella mangroviensis CBS 8886]|uniref:uncharacterized protein n=1 Tax=Kwoniella mangroviensis CBS 8507 TaxID=1296122 RepID=UPI00080D4C4C|nr:uncharacterized protein I203_04631 [Kwoniella mangroviensis CBS 8507]OCF66300.1 hypothetical protein I203_04631 [Kwoniella mangroviensis CBS 8507]OCF73437.1 hypothetical protein I204_05278 [Kwoniella mangroviensis CBS 8886]
MSRLDYHSILDPNNSVDVDVDAEFDNPTILNHHDSENQNVEDGVDVHSHTHGIAVGIMDDEHDDTPFVIMEEHAVDPDSELAQGTGQETGQLQEEEHDDIQIPILSEEIVAGPDEPKGSGRGQGHGPMSLKGMSEENKKQRQRLQNKLAAERSRNKRKGDQMNLEKQVDSLRNENAQLRARLTQLSSNSKSPEFNIPTIISDPTPSQYSPIPTTSSMTTTTVLNGTGIDYNYISKLTNELNQSKMTLLERKLKLLNIQDGTYSSPTSSSEQKDKDKEGDVGEGTVNEIDPIKESRKELINKYSKLQSIKAEEKSLNTLIAHIKNEIENLIKQRNVVEEKLNEKRSKGSGDNDINMGNGDQDQDQVAVTQEQQQQQQSVEDPSTSIGNHTILVEDSQQPQQQDQIAEEQNQNRNQEAEDQDQDQDQMHENGNLDDIRGWIDAAVKDWDQVGVLFMSFGRLPLNHVAAADI